MSQRRCRRILLCETLNYQKKKLVTYQAQRSDYQLFVINNKNCQNKFKIFEFCISSQKYIYGLYFRHITVNGGLTFM